MFQLVSEGLTRHIYNRSIGVFGNLLPLLALFETSCTICTIRFSLIPTIRYGRYLQLVYTKTVDCVERAC